MSAFFDFPPAARFGRPIPKSTIYKNARASARLQQLFVEQVEKIIWLYKLAPETINLEATKSVTEIQVFRINSRVADLNEKILRAIDKAIPFPIIFELARGGKRKTIAAYKRPSEADSSKWVVSEYFSSEWEADDKPRTPLPSALNLGKLYEKFLDALIAAEAGTEESIAERIERMEMIRAKRREERRIRARLAREKQFNKRVAINAELRVVQKELLELGTTDGHG